MPALYLVATPIGNMEDITLRALRILKEVGLIAAEDTRTTRHLLSAYDIKTPLVSYHQHSKAARLEMLLEVLAERDVALVSEAGTPGISDPGYELVVACVERGISVVPIPGPSAVVAAIAASGLPTGKFLYLGFLPRTGKERRRILRSVAGEEATLVAFEAPHRFAKSMTDVVNILGDRQIAVCRELTKLHEEIFRGLVSEAQEHFQQPRGEFTIVIQGANSRQKIEGSPSLEVTKHRKIRLRRIELAVPR
ncbi:MAG: tetrapyrrole methylase family protein [Dehalococcoidia bacterium]|nr:tetrapyrrole methylase family protein [Dehalococcoidia bacterium]